MAVVVFLHNSKVGPETLGATQEIDTLGLGTLQC